MPKKYKILHIITRFMKGGGAEKNTYLTIKGLESENYEIDLAIGGDSEVVPEKINVIKIDSLRGKINPVAEIKAVHQFYKLIRKKKYHLVHTHQSKAGCIGRLAAKIAGAPIIIHTLHGPLFHDNLNPIIRWVYILVERFLARFTDWFISVGEDLRDYYLRAKVGKPDRYSIIRSGMELEKFRNAINISQQDINELKKDLGVALNEPIVGMVGRLEPDKGWQDAVEVASEIAGKNPKVKFLFVGKGDYLSELERMTHRLGLTRTIVFTGYRKDIEQVMMLFDVLIFTSIREGLSQVLVQGVMLGKPIVSYNVLGTHEMISGNGFIVPLGDVKAMVKKIDYLLSDLERARIMGKKGKERNFDEWRIETMVRQIQTLYNSLLGSKNYD